MPPMSAAARPDDPQLKENALQVVEEMFEAVMQFKGSRTVDAQRIFRDAYSLTPELFMKADTSKLPMIIWGVFQFWHGYTMSCLRNEIIE